MNSLQFPVMETDIQQEPGTGLQKIKKELEKYCIQGDLNLMFAISRSIVTILELADTVPMARTTLASLSEALLCQAADVHGRILRDYSEEACTAGKSA